MKDTVTSKKQIENTHIQDLAVTFRPKTQLHQKCSLLISLCWCSRVANAEGSGKKVDLPCSVVFLGNTLH